MMSSMFYRTLEDFKNANGYTIDGIWYPRVTAIVSMKAKPGLYKFYGEQESFEAAEAIKSKSADEGTLMHDTVEAILQGQRPAIPENIKPAVGALFNFLEHNRVLAHGVEEKVLSKKHRYCGTLDVLADINGQIGVLDIKTSFAVFKDYGIQTAAYAEALSENQSPTLLAPLEVARPQGPLDREARARLLTGFTPTPLNRWILRLDQYQKCLNCSATLRTKGGNAKVRGEQSSCRHSWGEVVGEVELKKLPSHQADFKAFLACKTLWEWENEFWLKRV